MTQNTPDTLLQNLLRGTETVLPAGGLQKKLALERPLRVKAGFDPTASDLHLGHTVIMHKLRQFQDAGHTIIFLIGDFTATIGDPSGKIATRPTLGAQQVAQNAASYQEQAFRILDPGRTQVEFNSRWMNKMNAAEMIHMASLQTVARMLERDDFGKRYHSGQPISLHEFLYPLIQAYDSVQLQADIEIGGTDQTFNLLMGRQLQEAYGQEQQLIMTLPILEGYTHSAEKMSKSAGNYIGITEPAKEQYGKLMHVDDEKMWQYLDLLSLRPTTELQALRKMVDDGGNPRDAKMALAREIVGRFHGESIAAETEKDFIRQFRTRELPQDIPQKIVSIAQDQIPLANLLKMAALVSSTSEAHRLIKQGAIRIDGKPATDGKQAFCVGTNCIFQVGKRRIARITLSSVAG